MTVYTKFLTPSNPHPWLKTHLIGVSLDAEIRASDVIALHFEISFARGSPVNNVFYSSMHSKTIRLILFEEIGTPFRVFQ